MEEKSEVLEEFERAKKEGRQPNCVYCGNPLVVAETQTIRLLWEWDEEKKEYVKSELDGDSYKPYCKSCDAADWDFTNNGTVEY